jgi:NAD(P)-dependent dehydrogenase (short-subunit alcohol dehydrogenase family)
MDIFELTKKKILITGASSGIGRAIAIQCSNFGANLILVGRDMKRLEETKEQCIGNNHMIIQQDLTDLNNLPNLVENLPTLDGIVFSAGIIKRLPIKFIQPQALQEVFEVNVFSIIEMVRLLQKNKKINDKSSIVMISSVASDYASLGHTSYMMSKGAVNSMVRGLALELAKNKIRVNSILPGLVRTTLNDSIDEENLKNDLNNYPLGRFGVPDDVANACIYFLSDASKWVTGTKLVIDGGLTLR